MATFEVPKTFKQAVVARIPSGEADIKSADRLREHIEIREVPVPTLHAGQLLVRVEFSPINPSDLGHIAGRYRNRLETPYALGFEGAGTVVAVGGGISTWGKTGKKVAFSVQKGGAWGQFVVVNALEALVLPEGVTTESGCAAFVNPLSVLSMIEEAKAAGATSILHTAAASALGRMLIREGKANGLEIIGVVRREEQAETCRDEGMENVFVTTDPDFSKKLSECLSAKNCTLGYDAIAGESAGTILSLMPPKSTLKVYGGLSGANVSNVGIHDLIFSGKVLTGWYLPAYLETKSMFGQYQLIRRLSAALGSSLSTSVRASFEVEKTAEAVADYVANMSGGKVLIKPNQPLA
eukprot:Opistho-2@88565